MAKVRFSRKRYFSAMFHCLLLFATGPFTDRGRELLRRVAALFKRENDPGRLPEVGADELGASETPIHLRHAEAGEWNVTTLELCVINQLVASHRPRQVLEIGTFDGRTTLNMALNAPEDAKIYTLDLPPDQLPDQLPEGITIGGRFAGSDQERKIIQLHGDSMRFDFSPYHDAMDLVFVDARHDYQSVMHDSGTARKLVNKSGGLIVWHDYGPHVGVTRALDELQAEQDFFLRLKRIRGTSLAVLHVT